MARGWCGAHYHRWYRYGDPLGSGPIRAKSLADRFWSRVKFTETCWYWTGAIDRGGYGRFGDGRHTSGTNMAHRVAWLLAGERLDPFLELDHLCHTRNCVRRDHLQQVTHKENSGRNRFALQESCKWGHAATEENIVIRVRRNGLTYRQCRPCMTRRAQTNRTKR